MNFDEYAAQDGLGLAALIAAGDISAEEAAACAHAAIEAKNPELNAVLTQAQDQPFEPHRPFTGVPFLIKELVLQAQGVPSRAGSRATPNVPSPADSNLMQRFRGAGLQLVGTTQTPEMGYNATTETVAFGPVHNPWGAEHSAGGSSGGSGAAVAAGLVPLAHANDGGGSIRVPASCDGLVGLKPTRDRTPTGPGAADPLFGHAIEFAVTRSVRDSAALLDCVAGPDLGAPHIIAAPQTSFAAAAAAPTPRLRIGVISDSYLGQPIHDECRQAVTRATQELQNLGHEVSECTFRLDFEEFAQHINVIWCIFAAQFVDQVCTGMGCAADNDHFEAVTLTCAEAGRQASALELLNAMDYVNRITRETAAVFADVDMLMSSTLSAPPPRHGQLNQNDAGISAIDWTRQTFKYATNTPLFNSTGQPAISLPLHWSADGLPVGVQFAASMGEEGALLNLGTQLEGVYRWREQQGRLFS